MLEDKTSKIPDAEHLLESANDSARHFRNVYTVYLTIMIYTFIIVLSTHQLSLLLDYRQLLMIDKQLPFVNISVPTISFFTWIPWALLVLHFYLLIQAKFLFEKVHSYKQEINNRLISKEDIRKAKMLLVSVPLVHILVEEKAKFYLIVFLFLAALPLMVLISAAIKFLPYQDEAITTAHHIVILIYLSGLWYFKHHILRSHEKGTIWISSITGIFGIIIFAFVVIFINFPGNRTYSPIAASFHELKMVNEIMPNRLVLSGYKLVRREPAPELLAAYIKKQMCDENLIEPGSPIWCQYADPLDLRGRSLRKAQLQRTILCKATLQEADLTDADLWSANLTDANLKRANLTDADLWYANLTDANLWSADLTDTGLWYADLTDANLQSANLTNADLQSANLTDADLQSANLIDADLSGANLTDADLFRANLTNADLFRANLTNADLEGANLTDADLFRADLTDADLENANLTAANLSQTDFSDAILEGATLDFTWFWESSSLEEEGNFPIGIPKGWDDTLKPEYLCPQGFSISDYIKISKYIGEYGGLEREELQAQLKKIMEENCTPYNPQNTP